MSKRGGNTMEIVQGDEVEGQVTGCIICRWRSRALARLVEEEHRQFQAFILEMAKKLIRERMPRRNRRRKKP